MSLSIIPLVFACAHNSPTSEKAAAEQRDIHEKFERARAGNIDWEFVNDLQSRTNEKISAEEYRAAMHTMEPYAEFMKIIYGENSLEYAQAQMDLFGIYMNQEMWTKGEFAVRHALAVYETNSGASAAQRIGAKIELGYALFAQEKYIEAEQTLVQSLNDCERDLQDPSAEELSAVWALAILRDLQGRTQDASRLRKRAETMREQLRENSSD